MNPSASLVQAAGTSHRGFSKVPALSIPNMLHPIHNLLCVCVNSSKLPRISPGKTDLDKQMVKEDRSKGGRE